MKRKTTDSEVSQRPRRRAQTPEERENQLIALAMDRVEERMRNGTASGQEYVQFIRMASTKQRYEQEKTKLELELVKAKTENLRQQARTDALFADAIAAFKRYSGVDEDEDEDL